MRLSNVAVVFFFLLNSCRFLCGEKGETLNIGQPKDGQSPEITYPYFAPEEKVEKLASGYKSLKVGMPKKEVVSILGNPDDIQPTWSRNIFSSKRLGEEYVYLIKKSTPHPTGDKEKESGVTVHFNSSGNLVYATWYGIDSPPDIGEFSDVWKVDQSQVAPVEK